MISLASHTYETAEIPADSIAARDRPLATALMERLRSDPFSTSEELCAAFRIGKEDIIRLYLSLRSSQGVQDLWRESAHASFFGIVADLMSRPAQLEKIIRGEFTFPLFIEFHSGGLCPLRCSFCYNSQVDQLANPVQRAAMLQSADFRKIIDEIVAAGAIVLNVAGGGEPLCDRVVLDNLGYARQQGLFVAVNTMGSGLANKKIAAEILGVNQLRVSLNAASDGTYETIAGKNTGPIFRKVCAALRDLVQRRNETQSPLHIVTSFIIVPENFSELEDMVALSHMLGVNCAYIRPDYVNISRPFTADELTQIHAGIDRLKKHIHLQAFPGLAVSIGDAFDRNELGQSERPFLRILRNTTCAAHRFKVGIDAWGNLHRCALVTQPGVGKFRHVLGNLRTLGPISRILAQEQQRDNPPIAICQEERVTCNVFEGYFNAFVAKLTADFAFGIPPSLQPFAADPRSVYAKNPRPLVETDLADKMAILSNPPGRDLVAKWINIYPNAGRSDAATEIRDLLAFFSAGPDQDELKDLGTRFPVLHAMRAAYESAYRSSEAIPATAVEKELLFRDYLCGPLVVDIGCGWNILGKAILKKSAQVQRVIGFDIQAQHPRESHGVEFRLMHDPLVIAMPTGSCNTAILSFVLHHLEVDITAFLQEVSRVLAPGGRLLVLEDTFSSLLTPRCDGDFLDLFNALPDDRSRLSFLAFVDWFIHSFVNRSRNMRMTGRYRTMEQWTCIFERCRLHIREQQYLGFSKIGSRNPVSRGFFVLENSTNASTCHFSREV